MFSGNFAQFFVPPESLELSEKKPLLKSEDEKSPSSEESLSEYERRDLQLRAVLKQAQKAYEHSCAALECFSREEFNASTLWKNLFFYSSSCSLGTLFTCLPSSPEPEFKKYQSCVLAVNTARKNLAKAQNDLNQWMLLPREEPQVDENVFIGLTLNLK